ncbi:hypothetical protein D3C74_291920 [compost metagenome]
MGTERIFVRYAAPFLWSRPAFRGTEYQHRPYRTSSVPGFARMLLDGLDFLNDRVQRLRHRRMHQLRIFAFYENRFPAHAFEISGHFLVRLTRQDRWVADLKSIQVKDRQHRSVRDRVDEPVGEPRSRKRSGFGFPVAYDDRRNEVRVVQNRACAMRKRIPQFPAFMNRPRRLRCCVGSNPAREGKLLEQLLHPLKILRNFRIDFRVAAIQVRVRYHHLPAVTRSFDVEHIQIIFADDPVQVGVNEVLARNRAPVPDRLDLHIRILQRFQQQRVVLQVQLPHRDIVRCAPISVQLGQVRFGGIIDLRHRKCHFFHSLCFFFF